MRIFSDLGFCCLGLATALLCISFARLGVGPWGLVQVPVIVLALAVFFLKEKYLAALAIGIGVGLDLASAYPFFVWTATIAATAMVGWWLSKTLLTNRSLPSLIILGAAVRLAYFIFELIFSRTAQIFGGTVWYMVTGIDLIRVLTAFGIELVVLVAVFMIYVRTRGEHSRMLTHL